MRNEAKTTFIPLQNITRGQGIDPNNFNRETFTQFQTWIGDTNVVEGCPVNCQYCFFKLDGQTPKKPEIYLTPEDSLLKLSELSTYHPDLPVNFGSQTDAFSTNQTISYYTELLERYGRSDYKNPIIFITKKLIPERFMILAKQIPQSVAFYISYSGLAGTGLEPTVNAEDQRENFVRLKEHDLPRVHYWRPFLPQNSTQEKINEVLEHVSTYANCSVINGLRLNDGIADNISSYWPEILDSEYDYSKTGEFWPEGVRSYIQQYTKGVFPDYPLFLGNTPCALAYSLGKPDTHAVYKSNMCLESNCPAIQREKCQDAFRVPGWNEVLKVAQKMSIDPSKIRMEDDRVVISEELEMGKVVYLKALLRYPVTVELISYKAGHNWAYVKDENQITEVSWKDNWLVTSR